MMNGELRSPEGRKDGLVCEAEGQKSATSGTGAARGWFIWLVWSIWLIQLVWFHQINKTNQLNETDQFM